MLLSLWVGDEGPATIGLILMSDGGCSLTYLEFCSLIIAVITKQTIKVWSFTSEILNIIYFPFG